MIFHKKASHKKTTKIVYLIIQNHGNINFSAIKVKCVLCHCNISKKSEILKLAIKLRFEHMNHSWPGKKCQKTLKLER